MCLPIILIVVDFVRIIEIHEFFALQFKWKCPGFQSVSSLSRSSLRFRGTFTGK